MDDIARGGEGDADAEPPLFAYIREHEVGAALPVHSPFGVRPVYYADHTASGRALGFIEEYVRESVLPFYGNTHTSTSKTGRQSSEFVGTRLTVSISMRP